MTWSHQWPTQAGHYWFHGWIYREQRDAGHEAQTWLVTVSRVNGLLLVSTPGVVIRQSEGARGVFTRAEVPVPEEAITL